MHTVDPFRTLYDANHERVRRLLARVVGPQESEDLTQMVFARAAKGLSSFRGDAETSQTSPPTGYEAGQRMKPN